MNWITFNVWIVLINYKIIDFHTWCHIWWSYSYFNVYIIHNNLDWFWIHSNPIIFNFSTSSEIEKLFQGGPKDLCRAKCCKVSSKGTKTYFSYWKTFSSNNFNLFPCSRYKPLKQMFLIFLERVFLVLKQHFLTV